MKITYPQFTGECYSYPDAMKRKPEAWTIDIIKGEGWQRESRRCLAPLGLGHWEKHSKTWIYVEPSGYARPVHEHYGLEEPPPLPRQKVRQERCSCGKIHNCSACGQPSWIELHGVADGFCTYCYHAG